MGGGGVIQINGVCLYSHNEAYKIPQIIKDVLSKKARWYDGNYLARMLFSEMIKDDIAGMSGFGISTEILGDIQFLAIVDVKTSTIILEKRSIHYAQKVWKGTFDEYLKLNLAEKKVRQVKKRLNN